MLVGMVHVKKLLYIDISVIEVMLPMPLGIVPTNEFESKYRNTKYFKKPMLVGIVPDRELESTIKKYN